MPASMHLAFLSGLRNLLLALLLLVATGSAHAILLLAKTAETFKLAELQYAEARLQAEAQNYTVSRLMVDQATGSTLLELKDFPVDIMLDSVDSTRGSRHLSSSLRRCDWILEIIHKAETAEALVQDLRGTNPCVNNKITDGWTLDYLRFEGAAAWNAADNDDNSSQGSSSNRFDQKYSMKTLLASIAQALPTAPALDPQQSRQKLFVVDAKGEERNCIFLAQLRFSANAHTESSSSSFSRFSACWARRPFQYSSAINRKVAEIIIDWLSEAVFISCKTDAHISLPLLLDPTCGSGTFLALAMERGFRVEGYDVNPNCAEGSWQNLVHMFGEEKAHALAHVQCIDSSTSTSQTRKGDEISVNTCVVSNLPWGVNSVEYLDENYRILRSIHSRISKGTPCVFVTKSQESRLFQEAGFKILAQAHIPPRGFKPPLGKKKKYLEETTGIDARNGRNACVVTIASSQ